MYTSAALDLIGALEVRIRLIPIQTSQQTVKEICSVIVRTVTSFDLRKQSYYSYSEVACEIAPDLTAGVRKIIKQ